MTGDPGFAFEASGLTGYLAPPDFRRELLDELADAEVVTVRDRLVLVAGPERPVAWVRNVWRAPQTMRFGSINQAAQGLRSLQRSWALYPTGHHRRAALIESKLPRVSGRPLRFGDAPPSAPLGSWTLLDPTTALVAPDCSSAFKHGELRFEEDRSGPPNRAYLKAWEAITLSGERPGPGALCVDLGASPGGWTWVLQGLGARVIAVDKAPLAPAIAALPGIECRQESAFGIDPKLLGPVDWMFCDIACYPERLLKMVHRWLDAGTCPRMVCTLKFQGETDHAAAAEFAAIPGGRLLHLAHNKHELTWLFGTGSPSRPATTPTAAPD